MATIFGHKWDIGNGLKFDGVNDYVEVSKVFALADIRTVSFWMKSSNNDIADTIVCFGKTGSSNAYAWLTFTINSGVFLFGYMSSIGTNINACSIAENLRDNNIHNVVCVVSGSRIYNDISGFKCYVDGIEVILTNVSNSNTTPPVIQGTSKIGAFPSITTGRFYKDYLFDLKVFNKELSQAEVTEFYLKQGQIVPASAMSSLQLDYRFNNKSGTVLTDNSVNGYHGTLVNYAAGTTDLGASNMWSDKYGNPLTAY